MTVEFQSLIDGAKPILGEALKDGFLVLYLHMVIRPAVVRLLALSEARAAKEGITEAEEEAATKKAESEVPDVSGAIALGAKMIQGGGK